MICENFEGEVPQTLKELTTLPGVGRKTADVVLSNAFKQDAIAVDTHVFRVTNRIGIVNEKTAEKTEIPAPLAKAGNGRHRAESGRPAPAAGALRKIASR